MAIITGGDFGPSSLIFYMLAYTFMNLGAFAVVIVLGRKGEENANIEDYSGLGYKHPVLAVAMCIFMFSLAGIPPLAGFIGNFISSAPLLKMALLFWLSLVW
jgi:NADH-quinone oxidoreductase subunit N